MRNINIERLSLLWQEFAKFSAASLTLIANHKLGKETNASEFMVLSYSLISLFDYDDSEHKIMRSKIHAMINGISSHFTEKPWSEKEMRRTAQEIGEQFDIVMKYERQKLSKPWR